MSIAAILIDDDPLVRMTWEYKARIVGKEIQSFASFEEFRSLMPQIDKTIPVYIDSTLGQEKGEICAREIHEAGFQSISLVTGHPSTMFPPLTQMPWLKAILGKDPIF